jgi:hypothetical protein
VYNFIEDNIHSIAEKAKENSMEFAKVESFDQIQGIMQEQAQQHREAVRSEAVDAYMLQSLFIKAFFRKNGGIQFSLLEVRKMEPFTSHSFRKGKHINENVDAMILSWVNAVPVITSRGRFPNRYTFYPNSVPMNIGYGVADQAFLSTDPVVPVQASDVTGISGLDPASWERVLVSSGIYGLTEVNQSIVGFSSLKRNTQF